MATNPNENYAYDPTASLANLVEEPEPTLSMHPKRFALWLFIVSIVMIFASMTSAYIVRKGEGNWVDFELPPILWISTGVLIFSSFTVQMALISAKKDSISAVKIWMLITLVLSFIFLYMQWESWVALVGMNVYLVGNPSGSFLYILTGLHAFHLLTGMTYLAIVTRMAFIYKVHRTSTLDLEIAATYWHFLDFLWVALFAFLVVNHTL